MGSIACLLVLVIFAPPRTSLHEYALTFQGMAQIATWIFYPSLVLTIIPGLLAIAVTPAFHNAGWVGAKLATGVLIFEGGLVYIQGQIREEAARGAAALAGELDLSTIPEIAGAERNTLWLMLVVAAANVALGVWRPSFSRARKSAPRDAAAKSSNS